MARPPKPAEKHALDGTKGSIPDDRGVDFERVTALPEPPDFLDERGKAVWRELGARLIACKLLQEPDLYALGVLCAMQEHVERVFRLRRSGDTEADVSAAHVTSLRQLYNEFGLTPSSRRKVPASADAGKQNPFAKFKPHLVA